MRPNDPVAQMGRPGQVNIDIRKYTEWKEAGLVKLIPFTKNLVMLTRDQWDPDTGEKAEPQAIPLNEEGVLRDIEKTEAAIEIQGNILASLKELLADIKAVRDAGDDNS